VTAASSAAVAAMATECVTAQRRLQHIIERAGGDDIELYLDANDQLNVALETHRRRAKVWVAAEEGSAARTQGALKPVTLFDLLDAPSPAAAHQEPALAPLLPPPKEPTSRKSSLPPPIDYLAASDEVLPTEMSIQASSIDARSLKS
jgi:hypothetical protein